MTKTNKGSANLVSGASEKTNNLPGKVYFIRHGESTSNERNIFAGVLDVDLTAYGTD
jgi:2,3-bisphosphoglycerate-dependent phosphoglycerate mutase